MYSYAKPIYLVHRLSFQLYIILFPYQLLLIFFEILDWIFFSSNTALADTSYFLTRLLKKVLQNQRCMQTHKCVKKSKIGRKTMIQQ